MFPQVRDRRTEPAGAARPDPLRSRLRPARPLAAGVPAADLPDHAARPRRCLQGPARSRSRTTTRLFNGILNPKQIEGLRLLLTPFPQQQFNQTEDRRSERPSRGVACFDCHANGHTNGATHLVGDIRPQEFRHRIDTPSLRGVNIQRLFGSQRALKTVEDFTEFEQRGAYFDGDPVIATKKGVNILERGSQVHFMAEFQELLDFPPAPKLDVYGKLDPKKATPAELRGQALFFGKAQCSTCHAPPYYTDNTDAQPARRALLQAAHDQRHDGQRRRADQDVPAARHQGFAAVPARRPPADARGHRRVLQPGPGDQIVGEGEARTSSSSCARFRAAAARESGPRAPFIRTANTSPSAPGPLGPSGCG